MLENTDPVNPIQPDTAANLTPPPSTLNPAVVASPIEPINPIPEPVIVTPPPEPLTPPVPPETPLTPPAPIDLPLNSLPLTPTDTTTVLETVPSEAFYEKKMKVFGKYELPIMAPIVVGLMLLIGFGSLVFAYWTQPKVDDHWECKSTGWVMVGTPATPVPDTPCPTDASPLPVPSPSSTLDDFEIPSPTPTASASSKLSATPSPAPASTASYSLTKSADSVSTATRSDGKGYAVYVNLVSNGNVVIDQRNVNYTWTSADTSIATVSKYSECTNGIQSPCPDDHGDIKAIKEGSTTITATASWKDTGAQITTATFPVTVTHTPDPPQMQVTFPTNGQNITLNSGQQFCVVDVPVGGNRTGLQRKQRINDASWTSYADESTLCYTPASGANSLDLQYKNSFGDEASVMRITFTVTFN